MTAYYYRHLGLSLRLDRPLPRLTPLGARPVDLGLVTIECGPADHGPLPWTSLDHLGWVWRARTDDGSWLRIRYADIDNWAEFVVEPRGATVWVSCSHDVLWEEVCELLLGPVFSSILAQRGRTCLHAGVVWIDERVVGFVGAKGAGKSTTSLALIQHGALLVSDDVAALCELDGRPAVSVGAPRLRVLRDSADALCGSFEALEPMWAHEDLRPRKRYVEASSLPDSPIALDALYFLGPRGRTDQAPSIRPVPAVEAIPRLMVNRHMVSVIERHAHQRDFEVLARVAAAVRLRELVRPDGLHAIEKTVHAIRADLGAAA